MVKDNINYEKWAEKERKWWKNFDQEIADEKDKEYSSLLQSTKALFGDKIKSFDDLEFVSTKDFLRNMDSYAKLINEYPDKAGANYGLESILENRSDLTYEQCCKLFLLLDKSSIGFNNMRGYVANLIVDELDKSKSEDYLDFMDKLKDDGIDRFILILGLKKVDKKYRNRIIEILRRDVIDATNIATASKVSKNIKATELLPELKKTVSAIKNNELKREVEKTIEVLEKEIEKNK
jgi:hypothetical protein